MERNPNAQAVSDTLETPLELDLASLDTKAHFEVWLDNLRPGQPINAAWPQARLEADFLVECDEGTDCRISFEGVLHLEGLLSGTIRSESGTLVTGCGIIEGNIDVGVAFIEGSVNGNIRAAERVVLQERARVWGNIISRALSIKPGALFEGDCILHEGLDRRLVPPGTEALSEFGEQIHG